MFPYLAYVVDNIYVSLFNTYCGKTSQLTTPMRGGSLQIGNFHDQGKDHGKASDSGKIDGH